MNERQSSLPHDVQVFEQAIESFDRLRIAPTPDISQDFIGLLRIGIEQPTLVRFPLTNEGPELVEDDTIILFLQRINRQLVSLSPETARDGLGAHAENIGTVAQAAATSEHVEGLALHGWVSALIEILILKLLAAVSAEQILGPGWLFAVLTTLSEKQWGQRTW